ncbi:hypothetical protein RA307_15070 [Xanthobacteraceae bacterium Astr-EGSB]|uniref:hypothetical protein n=1 Tax=Astrobacterium formosum TaxID=3069710 RepID=UPI0027B04BD6|nr:hypothetical protein [Xanthobacteraceae bacterium Astr-EGSB]
MTAADHTDKVCVIFLSVGADLEFPLFARRFRLGGENSLHPYFPDAAAGHRFPDYEAAHVTQQLLDCTPTHTAPLAATLASHCEEFIVRIETQFERIKLGLEKKSTPTETFRQLQHAADFQELARERMRKSGKEDLYIPFGHPALREVAAKLMPSWKPRYTSPPFAKWRQRAKAIGNADDELRAVRKFTDLRSEMKYLAEAVEDAHDEFWGGVQKQEDVAQD